MTRTGIRRWAPRTRSLAAAAALVAALGAVAPGLAQEPKPRCTPWEIREHDELWLKGAQAPLIGLVEEGERDTYDFRAKGSGISSPIPKSKVDRVLKRETPRDVYEQRRAAVGASDVAGLYCIVWNCLRLDLLDKAVVELRRMVEANPSYPWTYELAADVFEKRSEQATGAFPVKVADEEALFWRKAEENDVRLPGPLYRQGMISRNLGLREQARISLRAAIEASDGNDPRLEANALIEIAWLLVQEGRPIEAMGDFERVIDMEGTSGRQQYLARRGYGLASLARGADGIPKALQVFQELAEADPEDPEPKRVLAAIEYARGRPEEAAGLFDEAVGLSETPSAELRVDQALAWIRQGRFERAAKGLDELSEAFPDDGNVLVARAYLALCRGDGAAAVEHLEQAAGAADAEIVYLRGVADLMAGEAGSALGRFREALVGGIEAHLCFRGMGEAHARLGNAADAVRYIRYSVLGREPSIEERCRLAQALVAVGDTRAARLEIDAALEEAPEYPPALRIDGLLRFRAADYAGARKSFEHTLELDPGDDYARQALNAVRELADLEVWTDAFSRGESDRVRNRWNEDESFGVEIRLKDGKCLFGGEQKGGGIGSRTRLFRALPAADAERFVRVEADIEPSYAEGARTGLRLEVGESGRIVVFVGDGKLQYAYQARKTGNEKWQTNEVGDWPEGKHTLGVALVDPKRWTFQILLDGNKVGEFEAPLMKWDRKDLDIVIYGEAEVGTSWKMELDELRIFRRGSGAGGGETP